MPWHSGIVFDAISRNAWPSHTQSLCAVAAAAALVEGRQRLRRLIESGTDRGVVVVGGAVLARKLEFGDAVLSRCRPGRSSSERFAYAAPRTSPPFGDGTDTPAAE